MPLLHEIVVLFQIDSAFPYPYNEIRTCMVNLLERNMSMTDYSATGNYYTIGHIALFTGLTDRTIRKYISSGVLSGELINGVWHFTPEQVEEFVRHPAVRPSILAKHNAHVYDFLLDTKKADQRVCMILDLPGSDHKAVAEYFCDAIRERDLHDFRFSFDSVSGTPRVILRGRPDEVLDMVNCYYKNQS